MDAADLATASRRFVLHSLRRDRCVTFTRGDNARLWDADGREYLDTMSGSAGPAMVGHANPRVAAAVAAQMATLPTTNILHQSDTVIAYCARLAQVTPPGLTRTALLAGGGDAVEAAVKLAMRLTGRTEILSLHGAYHGMSLGTMSLAGIAPDRAWFPGALRWPTFRQVPNADTYRNPLGDGPDAWRASVGALENALDGGYQQVAALVMEVVQGPGGHVVFPAGYYREVQRACRERGVLLIVDEIQTGMARCGAMWACELFDVAPDMLVAGKGIGGGVPVGAGRPRPALPVRRHRRQRPEVQAAADHPGRRLRTDARPGGRRDRVHPAAGARPRRRARMTTRRPDGQARDPHRAGRAAARRLLPGVARRRLRVRLRHRADRP